MIEFLLVVIVWLVLNPLYYFVPTLIALVVIVSWPESDDSGS